MWGFSSVTGSKGVRGALMAELLHLTKYLGWFCFQIARICPTPVFESPIETWVWEVTLYDFTIWGLEYMVLRYWRMLNSVHMG